MPDLPTILVIENVADTKDNKRHNRGYRQGARHMINDIISYLEKTVDIQSLDYLREQEKKIPRD